MKIFTFSHLAACVLSAAFLTSCNQPNAASETAAAPASTAPTNYFENPETGVQDGNVRIIPITTPKGKFNVWTKQYGNNPKIKVLLLNGGPGATHEYFECFENFLPKEGVEFIYYDQLGCGIPTTQRIRRCGACRATWRK